MFKNIYLILSGLLLSFSALAQSQSEIKMEEYFKSVKANPQKLYALLKAMPKGGDLHNHLAGASYAEKMIRYAYNDQLCINPQTFAVYTNPGCESQNQLANAIKNPIFYQKLIDAWSMRHFQDKLESGHDHFFGIFGKFNDISKKHSGQMLAEIANRAGLQNESYLEVMVTLDHNASGRLAKQLGWDPDFASMRDKLLANDFDKIITGISTTIDEYEGTLNSLLACQKSNSKAGCKVKIRYLYQALREQPLEMVFGQLLAGFEAASHDSRVVGLNLVQAEDGKISMRDYAIQMQMIGYLHNVYPKVAISLHAGELTPALVGEEGTKFHISQAVNIAKTRRIGHGVDIAQEENFKELLKVMAKQGILVEINLSSNSLILHVSGKNHPLPLYMKFGVPVTLSTDDEGINRSNLSKEYKQAVQMFNFNYKTLKTFARNSLAYSFLPGAALWTDNNYSFLHSECQNDRPGSRKPSLTCQRFMSANEKAAMQWDLEGRFKYFEQTFSKKLIRT
ncbi:MAG: adenosine deaminase [Tatlockia sp.]|nr:adenosine deaminase [Tatlockia sp.]